MTPPANSNEYIQVISHLSNIEPGPGRSASVQAGYQLAALFTTLGISITGGLLSGWLQPTISSFKIPEIVILHRYQINGRERIDQSI